jgi:E3 ubiquitin-protein ligase TRIP12
LAGNIPAISADCDVHMARAEFTGSGGAPLTALVRKLHSALSTSEAFPVLCSRLAPSSTAMARSLGRSSSSFSGGSFAAGSLSSGLAALTQPFKLRLVRHAQVRGGVCERAVAEC